MKLATQSRKKEYAAGIQSSELRLIDVSAERKRASDAEAAAPASAGAGSGTREPHNGSADAKTAPAPYNAAVPAATSSSSGAEVAGDFTATTADKFLTAATKEFEAGIVDQPLWKHAVAQSAGDRTAATNNYLRARATALRVAKREKRQERLARRTRALNELGHPPEAGQAATARDASKQAVSVIRSLAAPSRAQVIWIGSGLAAAFVFALLVVLRSESDAALHNDKSAISGSPAVVSAAKTAKPAPSTAADPSGARDDTGPVDWPRKLEQLKTDGNWNMLVLYAGEWARAQPDNASAWKALAGGYVKLRQYRDALDAASKAVQLAPDDAAAWQSLGQVNAALRQPAEALRAFEEAVARDDRDAASMVQIGTLATQLGRYPDAARPVGTGRERLFRRLTGYWARGRRRRHTTRRSAHGPEAS